MVGEIPDIGTPHWNTLVDGGKRSVKQDDGFEHPDLRDEHVVVKELVLEAVASNDLERRIADYGNQVVLQPLLKYQRLRKLLPYRRTVEVAFVTEFTHPAQPDGV